MNLSDFYAYNGGSLNEVVSRLSKEDRIRKYLGLFSQSGEYADFLKSFSSEDYATAFRNIHSIKGMSANLGLNGIAVISSEICEMLRPGVKPACDITPQLARLEAAFSKFRESYGQLEL